MNIINKSANVASSFDLYKLVQSPERNKMSDIKGQTITLDKWVCTLSLTRTARR